MQSQGYFSSSHCLAREELRANREGTEPGQLTPSGQRDDLCHAASCSAIKDGARGEKGVINLHYVTLGGAKTIIQRRKWCEPFFER